MLGVFAEDFRLLHAVLQGAIRICFNPQAIAQVPRRVSLVKIFPAFTEMNNYSGTAPPLQLEVIRRVSASATLLLLRRLLGKLMLDRSLRSAAKARVAHADG